MAPGDLLLVRTGGRGDEERIALWPITNDEWMMLLASGDMQRERLGSYSRWWKITGAGTYPDGTADEVVAFREAVTVG